MRDFKYEATSDAVASSIKAIFKQISKMKFLDKLIVLWYYSIMWFMNYAWYGRPIVAFFFGRWYFFFIAARLLHIPEMRHICCYLIGYRAYRAVRSPQAVRFCAAIAMAVTIVKTCKYLINFSQSFGSSPSDKPEKPKPALYMCYSGVCAECTMCKVRNVHMIECKGCVGCWHWNEDTWKKAYEVHAKLCTVENCQLCEDPKRFPELQGAAKERGVSPEPKGDKQENVWYKDNFECTPFDVTPSILSKNNWTIDEMIKFISPNCLSYIVRARTETTIKEKHGKAICIGGHTYLFNNHCVPFDTFEIELIFQQSKDGVNQNFTTLVTPIQLHRIPERDLLFIQLPAIPPKKDIRSLFAKKSFAGRFDGLYLNRQKDGSISQNKLYIPKLNTDFEFIERSRNVHIQCPVWEGKVETPTVDGDCGSVLISKTAMGPMILGIHVLGGFSNNSVAIAVDNETLYDLDVVIFSDSTPNLQVGDYKQELVELNKKATVRYIPEGTLQVYGSLAGFRGKLKSRVTKTLMSDIAVRDGYKRNTGPPVMNSYVPWRRALLDIARPVSHMDLTLLNHCVEEFTNDIISGLTEKDLSEVVVYDLNTAINGCPGLAYVDKMPRSTSAGFPFRKSKKYFLEAVEPFGDYQHPVKVTPEIEKEIDFIIVQYENSRVYCPVFTGSLKDEPTLYKKIYDGKTRVFCGAPLPWSLVVRMYFLSTIRLIQKNRFLFEAGPGTIAQSKEWDELFRHITKFGLHRIVAGDYGKFDKRMLSAVILAAFKILANIMRKAGWTVEELRVVNGVAEDTAFPTLDFNGELIRCYGSNPSGHPLTVIINGLVNCLYVRYCYTLNHPLRTCSDFKENIALMTYGDDMIMGVSENCTWFNHTVMQKTLADIDIEFTMADKEAESKPFIHISEATFLRRSWRFEPELDCHVCPIEHDSIDKMLTMCVESKTISPQLQAVAVFDTACREYFWYGREVFEEKRDLFYKWAKELNLHVYFERDLPSWQQLVDEFKLNSKLRD
jgi:hypothetical protein